MSEARTQPLRAGQKSLCLGNGVFDASHGEAALRKRAGHRNQLLRLRSRCASRARLKIAQGEAVRMTPEEQLQIVQLQGGAPQNAERKRAAQVTAGGLTVWLGDDGKPRFLADAVETVGMGGHILPWKQLSGLASRASTTRQ